MRIPDFTFVYRYSIVATPSPMPKVTSVRKDLPSAKLRGMARNSRLRCITWNLFWFYPLEDILFTLYVCMYVCLFENLQIIWGCSGGIAYFLYITLNSILRCGKFRLAWIPWYNFRSLVLSFYWIVLDMSWFLREWNGVDARDQYIAISSVSCVCLCGVTTS